MTSILDDDAFQLDLARSMADAQSASQALRALYDQLRAADKKFSLAWLADRIGLASKGHLSDIMSGRRPLREQQVKGLIKALHLSSLSARLIKTFASLEVETDPTKRRLLENRLAKLRKGLRVRQGLFTEDGAIPSSLFALDVFCAFWLFGGRPSSKDLHRTFAKTKTRLEVDDALRFLLQAKMVQRDGNAWKSSDRNVSFLAAGSQTAQAELIIGAIRDTLANAKRWLPQREQAYFETISISVDRARYQRLLRKFRDDVLVWQTRFESEKSDTLIRFNIQIYPLD